MVSICSGDRCGFQSWLQWLEALGNLEDCLEDAKHEKDVPASRPHGARTEWDMNPRFHHSTKSKAGIL